ncbi:MAG TPA: serine/threonine-protein kinase [Polyangiaceae bacterium]|nr:serine/threonine-protein kinase [Polyangiaceae bacterium]
MFPSNRPPAALDAFEILERLGAGGVGEVFLARSRAGKLVAIKTIGDAHRDSEQSSGDAFAREASVCARLRHPCIVQVRALLEEPGFAALVFEYVPGVALARVMRLGQARGVRLPDRAGWHVVERVLTALAYAHGFHDERGQPTPIVHRDLSPSNVLLDWTGGVKIADFGLAKVLGVSPSTRLGLVKGTLGCMAPEQARGDPVDERADVYAAALLAWRLATGRAPFGKHQGDEIELLRAMRNPRIKPLVSIRPDLPEALLDAVTLALEPERERRTITAADLADVVRAQVDVGAGWLELSALLEQCRGDLHRAVKRVGGDSTVSSGRVAHTMRYEEAALALDDDASPDGPTFEAHALPSDPAMRVAVAMSASESAFVASTAAARPRNAGGDRASFPLPPPFEVRVPVRAPERGRSPLAAPRRPGGLWGPVGALVAFALAAVVAAVLATWAR